MSSHPEMNPSNWIEIHTFTCKICKRVFDKPTEHSCTNNGAYIYKNIPEFIG